MKMYVPVDVVFVAFEYLFDLVFGAVSFGQLPERIAVTHYESFDRKRFDINVPFSELVENVQVDLQIFSSVKLYYLEPGEELQNRVLIDSIEKAKWAVDTAKQKGFDHLSVIFAFPFELPNKSSPDQLPVSRV
jgi:hypothetical protein